MTITEQDEKFVADRMDAMTEPTTAQIQDWVDNHPDTFGMNADLVLILLNRLEASEAKRDGWKRTAEESETQFRMLYRAVSKLPDKMREDWGYTSHMSKVIHRWADKLEEILKDK